MKVVTIWVVEKGSYSDYRVIGVFSSEANARFIMDALNTEDSYEKATVAEWPLDPAVDALRSGCSPWRVFMFADGSVEEATRLEFDDVEFEIGGSVVMSRRAEWPVPQPDALDATVWAKDEQHAVKITNEHRTRMIATGEWSA